MNIIASLGGVFFIAHGLLIVASTVVATGLIAWYAWRWPQQQA